MSRSATLEPPKARPPRSPRLTAAFFAKEDARMEEIRPFRSKPPVARTLRIPSTTSWAYPTDFS